MDNLFFLDYETNGLNPYHNEIIEVGIKKLGLDEGYSCLVKPDIINGIHYKYVPEKITKITGLTDHDIEENGKNKLIASSGTFKYIIENSVDGPIYILCHNGLQFDFIFFRQMIKTYRESEEIMTRSKSIDSLVKRFVYIDTVLLGRLLLPNESVSQPTLCKKYYIKNEKEHRAMGDVDALIKLYKLICEQLSIIHKCGDKKYYLKNPDKIVEKLMI